MERRLFLRSLASLLASAPFAGTALGQTPPQASARRFIDVHCHLFNAADLPVRGFLQRVVLSDYATANHASVASRSVWRGMVAKLAEYVIRRQAPGPQAELACLRGSCNGSRSATRSLDKGTGEDPAATLAGIFQDHYQRSRGPSTRKLALDSSADDEDVNAFTDLLLAEMKQKDGSGKNLRSRSLETAPDGSRSLFSSIAQHIQSGRSFCSRYFRWAGMLTDYRANIAKSYLSFYDTGKMHLALAAPALVDYNYWLQDQSPSPIADQIEVMAQLSLQLPKPVHGFAPFDPLRELRRLPEETNSFSLIRNALFNKGFLGVKLYSPMGFRPSGNAEKGLPFPVFASSSQPDFGQKLDGILDRLYAWCAAEEVPILAHTTDSQSAGPEFGSRADPKFWGAVLQKYPTLKVNLAHFGNFSQAFTDNSKDPTALFDRTWESEIGAFVKSGRYPNVYADISYFYWVLEGTGETKKIDAVKAMFKRYRTEFDPKVERLMFGTDWIMAGRANGFEAYVRNVEAFFRGIGYTDAQLDNLFFSNAIRFLGLKGNTKTMARLNKFYRDNGRTPPVFV